MNKKATWYRYLYDGHEPDDITGLTGIIKLTGELTDELIDWGRGYYQAFEMSGNVNINDRDLFVSIHRKKNGKFKWRKGNKEGTTDSFRKAWEKMPGYITTVLLHKNSPMTYHD